MLIAEALLRNQLTLARRDCRSGEVVTLEEALKELQQFREDALSTSLAKLDDEMREKGMIPFSQIVKGTDLDEFARTVEVADLGTFIQWVDMRRKEAISYHAMLELKGDEDEDGMYGWAIANSSAFNEVWQNLKQFIK